VSGNPHQRCSLIRLGIMQLDWLADIHRDAGLTVVEHTGWKTRTMRPFSDYKPVGLLNHHTAGSSVLTDYPNPPYYRNEALEEKCNLTIRGDGVVVILNAGWAFDSGYGDRKVLAAVGSDTPLPAPTDTYNSSGQPAGSNPGVGGNAWFIDNEIQHLGNGSAIASAQREALITSNAVICQHMGWDPAFRVIGHREWTTRKIDPRWGGFTNPMPQIRTDTGDAMQLSESDLKAIRSVLVDVLGGERITLPKVGDTFDRFGNQGIVNSVWHATGGGAKLATVLVEARDQARKAAAPITAADRTAIAAAVAAAVEPSLRAAVAAELDALVLKSA